jgi:hypothetical protein
MIQLYKPNSKGTGCAFSFNIGKTGKEKEPCIYINAIMQHSWNEKTKNGSFAENAKNPEKTIIVKLNEFELGGFIYAIDQYTEYSGFHTYEDNKTAISFKPYTKQNGTKAFSFSITKNSALKFGIGMEMGEAHALKEFFKFVLTKTFDFRVINSYNSNKPNE